jgi:hypothetical protein
MDDDDRTLVMLNKRDEDGSMWRAVALHKDGSLMIEGRDVGPGVDRAWGSQAYEFERHYTADEVATLATLLDVPDGGDLLDAIGARFSTTTELEELFSDHGIRGYFDSSVD